MKKVIALVILLTAAMTFFCTAAFADTTVMPAYVGEKHSTTTLATDVIAYVRATQFGPIIGEEIVNVSGSPGIKVYDATTSVLVSVRISNGTNYNYVLNNNLNLQLDLDYASSFPNGYGISAGVREITNYTDEAYLAYYNTNLREIRINPSVNWEYNGKIVVPANSTITVIAEIKLNAYYTYDSNGYTAKYPTLNAVSTNSATASSTTYVPIGQASGGMTQSQITTLLNYLDSIDTAATSSFSTLQDIEDNTDQIETLLNQLKTVLTWSGTFPTVSYTSMASGTYSQDFNTQVSYNGIWSYNGCYKVLDSTDFEPPDDIYSEVLYCHDLSIYLNVRNNINVDLDCTAALQFYFMNSTNYVRAVELESFSSDNFESPIVRVNGAKIYLFMYPIDDQASFHVGNNRIIFSVKIYTTNPTPSFLLPNSSYAIASSGSFVESDNNINGESNQIVNQSNQIHTQEQLYFEQNAQAIQATGLGNYQFSTNQASGVQAVTSDFNSVFNALGTWKNVYIFSLTLGLALTIIRHSPNAISRKIRNKMSE